jgi:hypothetical protein
MRIDQRNAGASVNNTTSSFYTLDRWQVYGPTAARFSIQQNAGNLNGTNLPAGFRNYLGITSLASTTLGASDDYVFYQPIEGFNTADLTWGTVNASPVTVSFWVRSSLTGTFGGSLQNSGSARSYVFSYSINSANTWEYKTVTIAGDTSGSWNITNGVGIAIFFSLGSGTSKSTTAGSWVNGNFNGVTGGTSVVGTNGATFYITGVQLEKGSTATSFDYRPYGTELALCLRYFQSWTAVGSINYWGGTGRLFFNLPVQMRATPTFALTGTGDASGLTTLSGGSFPSAGATFGRYDNTTSALSNWQSAGAFIPVSANAEL